MSCKVCCFAAEKCDLAELLNGGFSKISFLKLIVDRKNSIELSREKIIELFQKLSKKLILTTLKKFNCFPIINMYAVKYICNCQEFINIIPLTYLPSIVHDKSEE